MWQPFYEISDYLVRLGQSCCVCLGCTCAVFSSHCSDHNYEQPSVKTVQISFLVSRSLGIFWQPWYLPLCRELQRQTQAEICMIHQPEHAPQGWSCSMKSLHQILMSAHRVFIEIFLRRCSLCRHGFSLQVPSAIKWSGQTSAVIFILPHWASGVQTCYLLPSHCYLLLFSSVCVKLTDMDTDTNAACVLRPSRENGSKHLRDVQMD